MAVRLTKPWVPVDEANARLKGHLGVFQLANASEEVIFIGYAGGKSLHGLKGEVQAQLDQTPDATFYRVEITTGYLSRYRELMMAHIADHGSPPQHNPPVRLGRLSPA